MKKCRDSDTDSEITFIGGKQPKGKKLKPDRKNGPYKIPKSSIDTNSVYSTTEDDRSIRTSSSITLYEKEQTLGKIAFYLYTYKTQYLSLCLSVSA